MKKIICLSIIIIIVSVCLCGCSNNIEEGELSKIYKIPQKLIYINVPKSYEETQNGYSKIYFIKSKLYIAVTAEMSMEATELSKAQDIVFSKLKDNVKEFTYINDLKIEQEKTEMINEIEMYRYEGTLICGRTAKFNTYVVGYTFIIDKIPCNITGVVTEANQQEETIKEIRRIVDEMATTVRKTKNKID